MSGHKYLSRQTALGLLLLLASLIGPGTGFAAELRAADFQFQATLNAQSYQPGEAVLCEVTLMNVSRRDQAVSALDHASVRFTVQPAQKDAPPAAQVFVEPIFSAKEKTGNGITIPAQGKITRTFIFTKLTLKRGTFVLQAVATLQPAAGLERPARRVYAKPVTLTVAGEKALAHRYVDGTLAREDAIRLAKTAAGDKAQKAEAILVLDEMGFAKWWVNVTLAGGGTRAWFIDPYLARVWREAKPFTPNDRKGQMSLPKDSQVLQQMKERSAGLKKR